MNFYWYGGSGNWSDYTNHWSYNSGNSPSSPAAEVPSSTNNVVFDANSGTGTVTISATANCKNIGFTGSSINTAGTSTLNYYGNFTAKLGMTWGHTGTLTGKATDLEHTFTTNSVSIII